MASYVDVVNMAASSIGEDDQLRSPDDDTHVGRSAKAVWNISRRAAIRRYVWNFAKKRAVLPAVVAVTPQPWTFTFQLPATNLRLLKIQNCASRADYEVEGRTILCNDPGPLAVQHLTDIDEPASWDELFTYSFVHFLAFALADRITGDAGRKQAAWAAYKAAIVEATRANAIESGQVAQNEAPTAWEYARWGYGYDGADLRGYYPGIGPQIIS